MSKHQNPDKPALKNGKEENSVSHQSIGTLVIASRFQCPVAEPLVPSITHSSTYKLKCVDDYTRITKEYGYTYGRLGNPNCDAVACAINVLEGGAGSLVFPSGMAAISAALIGILNAGDHVVCKKPVYSETSVLLRKIIAKFQVEVTCNWVPAGCDVKVYRNNVKGTTRLLYGETPCNPMMTLLDLKQFGKLGEELGSDVITMVDGTFASPFPQQPMKYGIDISIHSCTKYLGGHSDLIAGSLTFKDIKMWMDMKQYQVTLGLNLSPHDASLLLRGIKTIHVRMPRHSQNALKVAMFLEKHPQVLSVCYPGLTSHPLHELAQRQMNDFSGMISAEIKGGREGGRVFVESCKLAQLAVSLGGVEILVDHPATMSYGPLVSSDVEREEAGITEGLIRISVGLEDADDIIKDFKQTLAHVKLY